MSGQGALSEDELPADLMEVAKGIAADIPARAVHRGFAALVIARALNDERERCARVVDAIYGRIGAGLIRDVRG